MATTPTTANPLPTPSPVDALRTGIGFGDVVQRVSGIIPLQELRDLQRAQDELRMSTGGGTDAWKLYNEEIRKLRDNTSMSRSEATSFYAAVLSGSSAITMTTAEITKLGTALNHAFGPDVEQYQRTLDSFWSRFPEYARSSQQGQVTLSSLSAAYREFGQQGYQAVLSTNSHIGSLRNLDQMLKTIQRSSTDARLGVVQGLPIQTMIGEYNSLNKVLKESVSQMVLMARISTETQLAIAGLKMVRGVYQQYTGGGFPSHTAGSPSTGGGIGTAAATVSATTAASRIAKLKAGINGNWKEIAIQIGIVTAMEQILTPDSYSRQFIGWGWDKITGQKPGAANDPKTKIIDQIKSGNAGNLLLSRQELTGIYSPESAASTDRNLANRVGDFNRIKASESQNIAIQQAVFDQGKAEADRLSSLGEAYLKTKDGQEKYADALYKAMLATDKIEESNYKIIQAQKGVTEAYDSQVRRSSLDLQYGQTRRDIIKDLMPGSWQAQMQATQGVIASAMDVAQEAMKKAEGIKNTSGEGSSEYKTARNEAQAAVGAAVREIQFVRRSWLEQMQGQAMNLPSGTYTATGAPVGGLKPGDSIRGMPSFAATFGPGYNDFAPLAKDANGKFTGRSQHGTYEEEFGKMAGMIWGREPLEQFTSGALDPIKRTADATEGTRALLQQALGGGKDAPSATTTNPHMPHLAGGGGFYTSGPMTMMVGDNPGGVEHVSVTPISGIGVTQGIPGGMAFGGGVNWSSEQVRQLMSQEHLFSRSQMEELLEVSPEEAAKLAGLGPSASWLSSSRQVATIAEGAPLKTASDFAKIEQMAVAANQQVAGRTSVPLSVDVPSDIMQQVRAAREIENRTVQVQVGNVARRAAAQEAIESTEKVAKPGMLSRLFKGGGWKSPAQLAAALTTDLIIEHTMKDGAAKDWTQFGSAMGFAAGPALLGGAALASAPITVPAAGAGFLTGKFIQWRDLAAVGRQSDARAEYEKSEAPLKAILWLRSHGRNKEADAIRSSLPIQPLMPLVPMLHYGPDGHISDTGGFTTGMGGSTGAFQEGLKASVPFLPTAAKTGSTEALNKTVATPFITVPAEHKMAPLPVTKVRLTSDPRYGYAFSYDPRQGPSTGLANFGRENPIDQPNFTTPVDIERVAAQIVPILKRDRKRDLPLSGHDWREGTGYHSAGGFGDHHNPFLGGLTGDPRHALEGHLTNRSITALSNGRTSRQDLIARDGYHGGSRGALGGADQPGGGDGGGHKALLTQIVSELKKSNATQKEIREALASVGIILR